MEVTTRMTTGASVSEREGEGAGESEGGRERERERECRCGEASAGELIRDDSLTLRISDG